MYSKTELTEFHLALKQTSKKKKITTDRIKYSKLSVNMLLFFISVVAPSLSVLKLFIKMRSRKDLYCVKILIVWMIRVRFWHNSVSHLIFFVFFFLDVEVASFDTMTPKTKQLIGTNANVNIKSLYLLWHAAQKIFGFCEMNNNRCKLCMCGKKEVRFTNFSITQLIHYVLS